MIPANELASMQSDALAILDQTATQQRATKTPDGYGSTSLTYATINAALACAIGLPTKNLLQDIAERVTEQSVWVVSVASNADIATGDKLLVTVNSVQHALTVESLGTPQSYLVLQNCLCSEQR